MSSSANTNPLAPSDTLVDDEDTRRIQRVNELTRILDDKEFEESVELHQQFRREIAKNPRKMRVFRRVLACLEADKAEVSRMDAEIRAKRAEVQDKVAARKAANKAYWDEQERLRKEKLKKHLAAEEARMMGRGGRREAQVTPAAPPVPAVQPTSAQAVATLPAKLPPAAPSASKKREASASPEPHRPAKKTGFRRSAGDWRCGKCRWWNARILIRCQRWRGGRGNVCGAEREDTTAGHHVQEKEDGVDIQESTARYYGDWRCGDCKFWSSDFRPNCGRCSRKAEDCKDAVDYNDELDHPPEYYDEDSSKHYWTGGVEPKGDPHASNAAYLGVKGRFKEKKNPYKPRD